MLHSGLVHLRPLVRSPGHPVLQRQPDRDLQQLRRPGGHGKRRLLPRRPLLGNHHRSLRQPPGPRLRHRPGRRGEGRDAGEGRQGLGHVCGQQPLVVHAQQLAHQQVDGPASHRLIRPTDRLFSPTETRDLGSVGPDPCFYAAFLEVYT